MRSRAAVQVKGAKGARAGDLLYFDKNRNLQTAGAALSETSTIPETQFLIGRGTMTITEYGEYVAVLKPWLLLETPKSLWYA